MSTASNFPPQVAAFLISLFSSNGTDYVESTQLSNPAFLSVHLFSTNWRVTSLFSFDDTSCVAEVRC